MITESLRHCTGIGPVTLARLHESGIRSWNDVIANPTRIPQRIRSNVVAEVLRSQAALDRGDISYFINTLCPQDKWRILADFFHRTSFFDIETNGLQIEATVTVIVCWHQGRLHTFVEHENLDEFLDLLDSVSLLVSFNGGGFDVPRVLNMFHVPNLPCPHLDLRWLCYHAGLTGGLKNIERMLNIARPQDVRETDGELAIQLWSDWQQHKDQAAREHLIRYCAADVLGLVLLAKKLANIECRDAAELWSHLPACGGIFDSKKTIDRTALMANLFGSASPSRLRTRRRVAG